MDSALTAGGSKPDMPKVYKDVGLTVKTVITTHDTYWDHLSSLIASGQSPDLMEPDNTNFYPRSISSNLVAPIDDYFDFDSDVWKDFKGLTEQYQINGKTYFSVEYLQMNEFLYYNPKLFQSKGLKTPLQYWREDDWTMSTLQELADELVEKNGDKVTRIGFVPGNIGSITGVELVEYSRTTGYKLNISNSKYARLMSYMEEMGVNGTQSAGFDAPQKVATGEVAMAMTATWAHTNELNDARLKGELEWCILPKLDKNSEYYYNVTLQPTFGLVKGAKNPEGAAYLIELRKWAYLNYPWVQSMPFSGTAYTQKYGEKKAGDEGVVLMTDAETAYTKELLSQGYDVIAANIWGGWMGSNQFPGITEVVSNGNKWSTVVANQKPVLEAVLKTYKFS